MSTTVLEYRHKGKHVWVTYDGEAYVLRVGDNVSSRELLKAGAFWRIWQEFDRQVSLDQRGIDVCLENQLR